MKFGILQWTRRVTRTLRIGFREEQPAPVLSMSPELSQEADSPEGHLDSFEDVDNLHPPFEMLRVDWCGSEAAAKACVAELQGNKYVVFVKQGEQESDIYRAVLQRAREAAKRDEVEIYSVNPVVLLALVRERMQAKDVKQRTSRTRALGPRSAVRVGFHDLAAWGIRNGATPRLMGNTRPPNS
ncbi:hypothetical protein G6F31_016366 [Rhizopus arrhizus]|nr:hypothetical protein G6F31_016366 [Rhizopus arrhizus]